MDIRNLIGGSVCFALAAFVVLQAQAMGIGTLYNPQAGFMPGLVGGLILLFSFILITQALRARNRRVRLSDVWDTTGWKKCLLVAVSLALYAIVVSPLGYLAATFLLMAFLLLINRIRWWAALVGAAGLSVSTWGLFYVLLKTPLPHGAWGF